jgi:hypothetical protein
MLTCVQVIRGGTEEAHADWAILQNSVERVTF